MKEKLKKIKEKVEIKDIIIFMIPFIVFLVILTIFYPGILTYDSFNQLNQISSNQFNNWHPFLHTFIQKICINIFNTPASVCILQILIFSIIWTCICKYNRKTKTKKEFILQIIVTLLIVLNPINSFYSITLWKDIIFSYMFLLTCFLIEILIDKKFVVKKSFLIILGLVFAIVSKLRHNGLYCLIIFLIILCIIFLKKKNKIACLYIISSFIISMIMISGLEVIYNVKQLKMTLIETKAMHALAYYNENDLLTESEKNLISRIVDLDIMHDNYNKYYSDALAFKFNKLELINNSKDIKRIFIRESFKHPVYLTKYILNSGNMTWSIIRPDDAIGTMIFFSSDFSNIAEDFTYIDINDYDNINKEKEIYKNIKSKVIYSMYYNKFLQTILYSASLYMYLSIVLIIILISKKTINYLLIILPNILNVLIIALSTPIQDIRYIYANFLIFYLVLIIILKEFYFNKTN